MNKQHPLLNAIVAADYAQTLAARSGFELVFDDKIETALTTYNNGHSYIVVPAFNDQTTPERFAFIIYMILHEIAHHEHGGQTFKIMEREKIDMKSRAFQVLNRVEDVRIENSGSSKYAGDRAAMAEGLRVFLSDQASKMIAAPSDEYGTDPNDRALMSLCITARDFCGDEHMPHVNTILKHLKCEKEYADIGKKYLHKIMMLPHSNPEGPEAAWKLALEIVADLWPGQEEREKWEQQQQPGQGAQLPLGSGDGSEQDDSAASGGAGDDSDENGTAGKGKTKQLIVSDHAGQANQAKKQKGSRYGYVNSGQGSWTYNPAIIDDSPFHGDDRTPNMPPPEAVRGPANKLRNLLQVETYPKTFRGLESGRRLSGGFLHRAALPEHLPMHSHIWETKRLGVNPTMDTVVTILVDCSASMDDEFPGGFEYIQVAQRIAGAVDHGLRDILHIPVRVVAFTDSVRTVQSREIKGWHERTKSGIVERRLATFFAHANGSTPTGIAMMNCIKHMLVRKERRKLLLCITDGEPFVQGSVRQRIGDSRAAAVAVGKMARETPDLAMYGICLGDTTVARPVWKEVFGDQFCVVDSQHGAVQATFRGLYKLLSTRGRR